MKGALVDWDGLLLRGALDVEGVAMQQSSGSGLIVLRLEDSATRRDIHGRLDAVNGCLARPWISAETVLED